MVKKTRSPILNGKIQFLEFHRPALSSGDYQIKNGSSIEATKPTLVEQGNDPHPIERKQDEKED